MLGQRQANEIRLCKFVSSGRMARVIILHFMKYVSTRGGCQPSLLPEAILTGLTPDGGLYFPEAIPQISEAEREQYSSLCYAEVATDIFCRFSTDFSHEEVRSIATECYANKIFTDAAIAPVRKLTDTLYLLELFHGPTGAFKDFALQFLPRIMALSAQKRKTDDICILVATSGDTGGAALAGFADVPGMHLLTFFPKNGVSPLQQAQMQCADGSNVAAIEIAGDFDGAQKSMKEIFLDAEYCEQLQKDFSIRLSSANSINIGRLLPQIFYVFSAHAQLVKRGEITLDEPLDLVVPSGNMGDIFAGYIAKKMGLPVGKMLVANNANDSAARFIQTGTFDIRNRSTAKTASPAMNILKASNLERLLFDASNQNAVSVKKWQDSLASQGNFTVDNGTLGRIQADFLGEAVSDAETVTMISQVFAEHKYPLDPHTAVGLAALEKSRECKNSTRKKLLFSTAHYAKFGKTVFQALFPGQSIPDDEAEVLQKITDTARTPAIPQHFFDILSAQTKHQTTCDGNTSAMKQAIIDRFSFTSPRLY